MLGIKKKIRRKIFACIVAVRGTEIYVINISHADSGIFDKIIQIHAVGRRIYEFICFVNVGIILLETSHSGNIPPGEGCFRYRWHSPVLCRYDNLACSGISLYCRNDCRT